MDTLIGQTLSHYRIVEQIGAGGMATVYLADDLKHNRKVALKVMRPDLSAAIGQEHFLREIEIAARLSHPHILPLFDSGAVEGQLFYVMPYVEGPSLRALLTRETQLPLERALRLTHEVASALGYAHQQGLVHRDIKPENVLLADGIALVADFGIARVLSAADTAGTAETRAATWTGLAVGTPAYMAPEQVQGSASLDGRADLYSLACMLYEMLAGQPPFTGATSESILHQHLAVEPRPVTEHRPKVPCGVAEAIAKGLAKLAADRYPTAARFAEALATAASGGSTSTPVSSGTEPATPNNLPSLRTRFIGRERELAACARLLSDARLLTLTGIGGSGKTRLALRLAESLLGSFPDGVWWVDLAPVQDPSRIVLAVAGALDVQEQPGTPPAEALARRLREKRAILLLDNCEDALRAVSELVEAVLAAGAKLKVIVTSREALGITGEQTVAVQPMSLPVPAAVDAKAIGTSDAVKLFVDRARLVEPGFVLDPSNAVLIGDICSRLDGIPLAIELAAARAKVLTVNEIRSRLDDRFRLLTGGGHAATRHQTLRATIQWSYEHLDPEEQRFLRLLAVFLGGWTLEAATAVAVPGSDEFAALDLITRLIEKSLVVVEHKGAGSRYRMLETVRRFADERLEESGEGNAARSRHLLFYVAFAEEAEEELRGPDAGTWLSRLESEVENILSAHAWCGQVEEGADLGLRIIGAAARYWILRGSMDLGYRLTMEALERAGANVRTPNRCRALLRAGSLANFTGHLAEARAFGEEALSISREIGDKRRVAAALSVLGGTAHAQGDRVAARSYLEEALLFSREVASKLSIAAGLENVAEVYRGTGDLDEAEPRYREALALMREEGYRTGIAICLLNLTAVAIARGACERARRMVLEALDLSRALNLRRASGLLEITGLAARLGDWERAARFWGAEEALRESIAYRREPADEAFITPLIALTRSALGDAAFEAAEAGGRGLTYEEALAEARAWLEGPAVAMADHPA